MNKINIGLIGYGVVGQGVVKFLQNNRAQYKKQFNTEFNLKTLCDRSIQKKNTQNLKSTHLTTKVEDVLNDKDIDVVIELIGGLNPAKSIVKKALSAGKVVITANKSLIADSGQELFKLAQDNNTHLYYESSVGAGIPIIKAISEGVAGNSFNGLYGIINGTCNFILSEMSEKNLDFDIVLKEAQKLGYAESDPTLDVNGMDSAHKLAILVTLAFGKAIDVKDIYTEGITHISYDDIEYAENLGLTIKLLAIAKKVDGQIEARVHPTLISQDHPLASINSIYNAIYLNADPLGNVLLSGEGAGQMAAASGVISDLINYAASGYDAILPCNNLESNKAQKIRKIDNIESKFYLRFMAKDQPGVLSQITGILGKHHIGINSVTQKVHNKSNTVPVIMLTEKTTEKAIRSALNKIYKLATVSHKPVAIRMEKLR